MDAKTKLRAWIDDEGLTHAEAADRLDCSASLVTGILGGKRHPGLPTAHAIERETRAWKGGQIRTEEWDAKALIDTAPLGTLDPSAAPTADEARAIESDEDAA